MGDDGDAERLDRLADELGVLHRGRGLRRSTVGGCVGPALRAALDLGPDVSESRLRLTVVDALVAAARNLPPDLRVAFLFASAIRSERGLLHERLSEVGVIIDRDPRTVRRRVESANLAVARDLLARHERLANHPLAPTGWTVVRMAAELDLRGDRPRFSGEKTVLAGQRMSVLTESVSIPRPDDDIGEVEISVEVLAGGSLRRLERRTASSWRYEIDLDGWLDSGDVRRIDVAVTVPSERFIAPYNVLVPLRPCAEFEARVRFSDNVLPASVQRVDGVTTLALNDRVADVTDLAVSPDHDVRFTALVPGLAYGLRWTRQNG